MLVLWFISGMFFPDAFEYTVYLGWFLPFYVIKINLLQHSQVHAFSQQMWPSASHGPHLSHSALPLMKPSPACSVWVYDLTAAHFTLILLIRYLFVAFITPSILRYLSWASWMSRFPAPSMSTDGKVGAQQVRKCCLFPTLSMKSHLQSQRFSGINTLFFLYRLWIIHMDFLLLLFDINMWPLYK